MRNSKAMLGIVIVAAALALAVFADLISPYSPTAQTITNRLAPPFWLGGSFEHLLGTDALGRDLLSRIIHGSRVSIAVGLVAVLIQGGVGTVLGLFAGYYGKRVDDVIMRIADIQLALPFFVLALAVVAVLGPGLWNTILALGLTGWVLYGRAVRGEVLSVREREFVDAARLLGASNRRIVFRHIFPNVTNSLIVIGTLQVARMIIFEASLSYLGLGVQPPTPTWGGMIADGRDVISIAWWVATLPGLAVMITVLGVNLLGDYLRDQLDPHGRER